MDKLTDRRLLNSTVCMHAVRYMSISSPSLISEGSGSDAVDDGGMGECGGSPYLARVDEDKKSLTISILLLHKSSW